ncbi:MAG: hypothetical protein CMJ34_14460 [Phycisphaerae bacterium]|nr:hypothetical protein [Phycisphaerae bacterium]
MTPGLPIAALTAAMAAASVSAETITVCAKGCDFTSINAAIAAASDGDAIQLRAGTYSEGVVIDTLGRRISIVGVADRSGIPRTILDGGDVHGILQCIRGEGEETIFENLVIRNGSAPAGAGMYNEGSSPTLTNCTFTGNSSASGGGGMSNRSSSPTLVGCMFEGNSSVTAGAMSNFNQSSPVLVECVFRDNTAGVAGAMSNILSCSPTMTGCSFTGNSSEDFCGVMFNLDRCNPALIGCTFEDNSADGSGGVMVNSENSNPSLTDCTFARNSGTRGGGIFNSQSSPVLNDCEFIMNSATFGGGMYNNESAPCLDTCTFTGNSAFDGGGGGMYNDNKSNPTLNASLLCDNGPNQISGPFTNIDSCITESCRDCDFGNQCPGDLNDDEAVDAADLEILLARMGSSDEQADLDRDGEVGGADLGLLSAAWGPCR